MKERPPKILSVVDTRQYEERGDRMVPIPGSGDARDCDRCGRAHEVHATVAYEGGRTAVVGTGCMGLGAEAGRRVASSAGTVAKYQARAVSGPGSNRAETDRSSSLTA